MAYATRAGRARASAQRPRAFAVCDRCGIWYNHHKLVWQFDWAGASIVNKRSLVCPRCLDNPQQQLRAIILPADPVPVMNPRPEQAIATYTDYRVTSGPDAHRLGIPIPQGAVRTTQDDRRRVTQQTGEPPGGKNQQPGTDPKAPDPINLPPLNDEMPETGPL
jgi:hypothetical protein